MTSSQPSSEVVPPHIEQHYNKGVVIMCT